jgi:hypothetical protein
MRESLGALLAKVSLRGKVTLKNEALSDSTVQRMKKMPNDE